MTNRLAPLLQYVSNESTLVSVGVGQGEEVCGLYELFGDRVKIIGVDVSSVALDKTQLRVARNQFRVELQKADAVKLPFENASVDALILSSTLHEIFSYHEDGMEAFCNTLKEARRVLKEGGVIFIRDFAGPDYNTIVTLQIKTPIAIKFYEAFRASFRRFTTWDSKMDQVKLDDTFLPPLGYGTVHVPIAAAAELLLHFRSFWSDYQSGNSSLGDPNWKESDEVYLITEKSSALNPDQYIDLVLKNVGNDFTLVFKKIRDRDATNAFLVKHFTVSDTSSLNLIPQITRKLEVMFQKNPKVKKHYSAAVVFDANRSVLLCKRSPTKKIAPNMWHLPGGTIELDENPIETIQRELEEELGLKSISVLPTSVVFSYEINNSIHQTHVFRVDVSNKPIIMNAENSEFAFVPRDQIKNYIEPHLLADNMRAVNVAEAMY